MVFSSWRAAVGRDVDADGLDAVFGGLLSWDAHRLRDLGWEVSLIVVQEFRDRDDPGEKGISVSTDLVRWLADARAGLEIDQYLY